MDREFQILIESIKKYNPRTDQKFLTRVWEFAKLAHAGHVRHTGEDYALHSLRVATILASWKLDDQSIAAGLLHDVLDSGAAKKTDVVSEFGEDVYKLVDGASAVKKIELRESLQTEYVENLRKMILAMSKDLRVIFIKLADRVDNMRTLEALPPTKQKQDAKEALELYAPLAERLGIGGIKGELEDTAFSYLHPVEYKTLIKDSKVYYKNAEECITKMKRTLLRRFAEASIHPKIYARKKHLYSLWRKLHRDGNDGDFSTIHDIVAMRILVDTVSECYSALGIVHAHYKPVPYLGVADYIAQPKPNGYQSIHTKVFGPDGRIVEVQIRTHTMHEQAEFGVAAHWSYAEAKAAGASDSALEKGVAAQEDKLQWVKQLVDWQEQIADPEEYLKAVKFDALSNRIFVFSPKGDVFDLPAGATPVDFAFHVHTDLGKYIQSALVNGKIVPLSYQLQNGQVCEILKSKNPHPVNNDWLSFAKTTVARSKIQKLLKKEDS